MGRVNFIQHKGKPILHIDFSRCDPATALQIMEEAKALIAQQPPQSLRTLTDVTETRYDKAVTHAMNDYTTHNRPFVKAAAVLGANVFRRAMLLAVATFSRRDLRSFDDATAAKDWLVEQ